MFHVTHSCAGFSVMLRGIVKTAGILYLFLTMARWKVNTAKVNEDYDPNHVRTWTGWYNTDKPHVGGLGDDESVDTIRLRGYEICLGQPPVGSICRDTEDIAVTFSADTRHIAADHLFQPCNNLGLICRNEDQENGTCRDYEIRFECLVPRVSAAPENLGIIGVAAGLSVLVPILCVAIMHIVRLYRARQRPVGGPLVQNIEQSAQTETADLPPSYSVLFGDFIQNQTSATVTSSASFAISISDSGGDIRYLPSNQVTLQSIPENQMLTVQSYDSHLNTIPSSHGRRINSWRRRFPNMHLSIFEIFTLNRSSSNRAPSPAPSYASTPPPSYKDALNFLGGNSSNTEDSSETEEKTGEKN